MGSLTKCKVVFFERIGLVQSDNYRLLDFLIRSHKDIDTFISLFLRDSKSLHRSIEAFRVYKKKLVDIDYNGFKETYVYDKQYALELILQEPINPDCIHLIQSDSKAVYNECKNDIKHTFISLLNTLESDAMQQSYMSNDSSYLIS